jgi:hypothetical protein
MLLDKSYSSDNCCIHTCTVTGFKFILRCQYRPAEKFRREDGDRLLEMRSAGARTRSGGGVMGAPHGGAVGVTRRSVDFGSLSAEH